MMILVALIFFLPERSGPKHASVRPKKRLATIVREGLEQLHG
jgi:hypothetical protein